MNTYVAGAGGSRIRVLVVDDHALIRDGLRRLLECEPDIEVVAEAGTGEDAIAALGVRQADIVLLDMRMPGMSGVEATRAIRSMFPEVRIVILTAYPEHAAEAMLAGARGYLLKTAGAGQLLAGLRGVFYGARVFDETVAEGLTLQASRRRLESGDLSPREVEVLRLLVRGLTNRAIARGLGIGARTADQHVHSIFLKTGARSRAEAVMYALKHQLVGSQPD